MSRIPKYQAWLKDEKRMIAVPHLSFGDDGSALTVMVWLKTPEWRDRYFVVGENAELREYTGIKDKYGNEIYEGDIVAYADNTSKGLVKRTAVIEDIRYLPDFQCSHWEEIIGNIYENPELLGVA